MTDTFKRLLCTADNVIHAYEKHGIHAKVFGSVAKGRVHHGSDLDIVIMDSVSPAQYVECLSIIARHDDMPCDLLFFDEIQSETAKKHILESSKELGELHEAFG